MAKVMKCSECEYGRVASMPRHGTAGSWRSGSFSQNAYVCQHPNHFALFYGKTSPRTCPLRKEDGEKVAQ